MATSKAKQRKSGKRARETERFPYLPQPRLITPSELRFLHTGLQPAIGENYFIAVQVPLTAVITVDDELWDQAPGRKIRQKRLDFVLAYPKTMKVVAAIELDDLTHQQKHRRRRDNFVEQALSAAGVLLIRIPVYKKYDAKRIRGIIRRDLAQHRKASANKKKTTGCE